MNNDNYIYIPILQTLEQLMTNESVLSQVHTFASTLIMIYNYSLCRHTLPLMVF